MGNQDGVMEAAMNIGRGDRIKINENTYFSFAMGNEIALCTNKKYYILNCSDELWEEVKKKVKETKSISLLKKWWLGLSKKYQISNWSNSFNDLLK